MPALPDIVLASTSPFRRACLERLALPFTCVAPGVDEHREAGETPLEMALRLAQAKAAAVARRMPAAVVIAGDQVLDVAGRDYGKPGDHAGSVAQLTALSGQEGVFHSGNCVMHAGREWLFAVPTTVRWRELAAADIEAYLAREPSYGSAGAAQLEGHGITLTERMTSDDPSALLGVPLIRIGAILRELGFRLPG